MSKPKILIFDIETAPNQGDVWGLWQQNIGLNQLLKSGHIMSYAAKWYGEKEIFYVENRRTNKGSDRPLVKKLIKLMDEADIVIGHNGKRFDVPWVQGRAALYGIKPPSPFRVVDTLLIARRQFNFPSNKLEYLLDVFGCSKKLKHKKFAGHELWTECLAGNDEAWAEMKAYNIQDTVGLEELYTKLIPWTPNHPNMGVYTEDDKPVCNKCGSDHVQKRGTYMTNASKFQRYQCVPCGAWSRGKTNLLTKEARKEMLVNAV